MIKNFLITVIFAIFVLMNTANVFAIGESGTCITTDPQSNHGCDANLFCKPSREDLSRGSCEKVTNAYLAEGKVCLVSPQSNRPDEQCDNATGLRCVPFSLNSPFGQCEKTTPSGFFCFTTDNLFNHGCNRDSFCKPLTTDPEKGTCAPITGASIPERAACQVSPPSDRPDEHCNEAAGFTCKPITSNPKFGSCEKTPAAQSTSTIENVFGKIQAPAPLAKLLEQDKTGAGAISTLLSNFVNLIFSIAAVVLLFMVLWGAFDWMVSEGDKEKVASARSKILNAMIGLILIAIAFAIVRLLSQFTGFTFFKGQNPPFKYIQDAQGKIMGVDCLNGTQLYSQQAIFNPAVECEKSKGR